jgi:hypothetical protein
MSRQVPHAEDTATGTPTLGLVPISAGPGLAPAWGAAGGGGGGGGSGLPRCAAYCSRDATFDPVSGAITQVPLDRDQYDPDNWHDETTSSPYVIVPATGDYLVLAEYRPASISINPRIPMQLWLYGGASGNNILDRDEDTYHQDDEHTGAWGNDSLRTLRIIYADHLTAGDKLNIRFRHFSGGTDVQFQYQNDLGPRLIVTKLG